MYIYMSRCRNSQRIKRSTRFTLIHILGFTRCCITSMLYCGSPSSVYCPPAPAKPMLGEWVNPQREQQTLPQGQTSIPPKSFSTPTANGQSAP